ANADRFPPVRLFAAVMIEATLEKLASESDPEPVLGGAPPPWSERALAEVLDARHARNIRDREPTPAAPPPIDPKVEASISLDGCWLQGFADVTRSPREEYGLLFRIYAAEQGDGDLEWNHNWILRNMYRGRDDVMSTTLADREFFEVCTVSQESL